MGSISTKQFFWVIGQYNGRRFRLGSFASEQEASEYGYEKLPCSFDVVETNTRDPNRAIRELKKRQLDENGDLGDALQKGRRKPPDEYKSGSW